MKTTEKQSSIGWAVVALLAVMIAFAGAQMVGTAVRTVITTFSTTLSGKSNDNSK